MTRKRIFLTTILLLFITVNIYLFVSAPQRIGNQNISKLEYSSTDLFNVLAHINDQARTLYTNQIVQKGKEVGIKFDEDWKHPEIEAGPLPALFLRETSTIIEKSKVELGLFLGSDSPISKSNSFSGIQQEKFEEMKKDSIPKYFFDASTNRNYAMFPDYAVGPACVSCHNEHKESPKTDWQLNDIMGATTWSIPMDSLTTQQMLVYMRTYIDATIEAYEKFLDEARGFKTNEVPNIGEHWPSAGYYLPDARTFRAEMENKHATNSLNEILKKY